MPMLQAIVRSTVGDFLIFPFWWYSKGFFSVLHAALASVFLWQKELALDLWVKNIFVPMYGQYDIAGRIISFFMRLAQIVGRTGALAVWAVIAAVGIGVWLALPGVIVYQIIFNLGWL